MKKLALKVIVIAAVTVTSAFAQMGAGGGWGQAGMGRFAWNQDYLPGWSLMTSDQRTVWRINMREAKTYDECKALQEVHRKTMEVRASEMSVELGKPRFNGCDVLKARGFIK